MGGWFSGNAVLALCAAAFWGVGDFSGGMGAKHAGGTLRGALRVVLLSHCTSFVVLLGVLWIRGDAFPHGQALLCGLAAGVAGGLSLTAFYMCLAQGAMGTAAAISGLLAAIIPALVSLAIDGAPGLRKAVGFLVAGVAIWLIAGAGGGQGRSGLWLAIGAGAGFGVYFVLLRYAGAAGVFWPMATARMGSLTTCLAIMLVLGGTEKVHVGRQVIGWVLGTALFDTSGNLLFVAATRAGRLDVAAVLASLYPASTILLAAWLLRERPTGRQKWGMAVACAAVLLVAG